jgi:ferredoxin
MSTTLYYFTGTGNSLMVARHLAEELGETQLLSMPKEVKNEKIALENECIGLIFPVYYYGIPLIVREFLKKIDINAAKYIFCIATCGGSTGMAFGQVSKLLQEKGTVLASGFKMVLPDNYVLMYNPTSEEKQIERFNAEKIKIKEIAKSVRKREHFGLDEKFFEPSKLIAPLAYKHTAKFGEDARRFWTNEKCNGCSSCKALCPVKNIEMKDKKPIWNEACQQCLACIHWCPHQAIEYGKGTKKRRRYRNPEISIKDIINSAE